MPKLHNFGNKQKLLTCQSTNFNHLCSSCFKVLLQLLLRLESYLKYVLMVIGFNQNLQGIVIIEYSYYVIDTQNKNTKLF